MNHHFRTIAASVITAVCCMGVSQAAYASEEETPIITFKTNIYELNGDANHFGITLGATENTFLDIDMGFGTEEHEVGVAVFNPETQAIEATYIGCRVSKEGIVRIYGDASKIDYIDAAGCYIDWIDMDACVNLSILNLSHNELKRLDLTPFSQLQALYLSDNTFSAATPLKVGGNKPGLMIMELDIIDYLDPSFNLSDYPALVSFDGYHNLGLKNADPSGCPDLASLSLEMAPVSSLDVSKNPKLIHLNISETNIRNIDLSKNTELQRLFAEHVSGSINTDAYLHDIDISNNTKIVDLVLGGNHLKSIDLSKLSNLQRLALNKNELTSINLDGNPMLMSVNLANNDLDFTTLPLPENTWTEYYYYREPMACARSYAVGAPIDFAARVLRAGTETSVRVWSNPYEAEPQLVDEDYYSYADGKVTFNAAQPDSVYIEFINSGFPEYTISTAQFMVKDAEDMGKPTQLLSFVPAASMAGKTITMKVGLDNASAEAPQMFYVDMGEGLTPFTATTITCPGQANVSISLPQTAPGSVALYIPEGSSLTAFEIKDAVLASIDLSAATELRWLTVSGCGLENIDMAYNRCLQSVDISGNKLTSLDLKGIYGDYEKNVLVDINASNNALAEFNLPTSTHISKLNLSGNKFTTFSLKDYDGLTRLDLSNNLLADELNLSYLSNAVEINLSGNALKSLVVVDMPHLEIFNVTDNNLTIQTLPLPSSLSGTDYIYAPQKPIVIVDKAPAVNLSAQNVVVDGVGTTFTWKKSDGTALVEGVDMECVNGGTRFLKEDLGTVYCEMTNPAFPEFKGVDVQKTTETMVVGKPSVVVASFTTTENSMNASVTFTGSKVTALYIDWRGDGTEYIQYPMQSETYTVYDGQATYAGADVKVYTYGEVSDVRVFSIDNAKMSQFDASPMTNLVALTVTGAGLDDSHIKMPASENLSEINLSDNALSEKRFDEYGNLAHLILAGNGYESFDASVYPNLQTLMLGRNNLSSVKFGNPMLWGLSLEMNALETLSLEGAPSLEQVLAHGNKLSSINLAENRKRLQALNLEQNNFTFATLPRLADLRVGAFYRYGGQQPVEVECVNGEVDLSAQASVSDIPTEFRWYLGQPEQDPDTGELSGEELWGGWPDPEYTVSNGVVKFFSTFDGEKVVGVMTNPMLPLLELMTVPIGVDKAAGVENVSADNNTDLLVDVYTVSGVKVRSQVDASEATRGLTPGFYIVGTEKVLVK